MDESERGPVRVPDMDEAARTGLFRSVVSGAAGAALVIGLGVMAYAAVLFCWLSEMFLDRPAGLVGPR